jgi:hypothetical protein
LARGATWIADVTTPEGHPLTGNEYRVVAYHLPCHTPNGALALSVIATHSGLSHSPSGHKFHCEYSRSTLTQGRNGVCSLGPRAHIREEFAFTADLKTGH